MAIHDHVNGLMDAGATVMDDIPDLSIAVTEIGVIPPPPMFSSPSPPPPPPPPTVLTSNQVANGHVIVNHQVFHTNITVDGHDLSQQQDSPPTRYIMSDHHDDDDDADEHNGHHEDDEELEDEDELEDDFEEYPYNQPGVNTRVITTVPAKEPVYNAVPLKSALKKPKGAGANGISIKSNVDHSSSSSR